MKLSTSPNVWLGTLLLAAVAGTSFYWRHASSLRLENQALERQIQEAGQLPLEGVSTDELLTQNAEVHRLKAETRDLHKLRNEVRQLREQTQGLDLLRAENEQLTAAVAKLPEAQAPAIPRPAFTLEQLKFSGYGTPEATLVTMFWAMTQGDLTAATRCWSSDAARTVFGGTTSEHFRQQGEAITREFGELRIAAKKMISAEEALLGVQIFSKRNEKPEEIGMPFKRIGDDWKLSMPPSH